MDRKLRRRFKILLIYGSLLKIRSPWQHDVYSTVLRLSQQKCG